MDDQDRLTRVLDEFEIRQVYGRYSRGIDRRQFDLVRSCYHPDGWDEHGDFSGGVEDFIAMCERSLDRYTSTQHFLGTVLIEVDGARARGEAYAMAIHRVPAAGDKPERDHVVGLRYVDDFERRSGEWRILTRVCVFDWTRTDPVAPGWTFRDGFRRGDRAGDRGDAVFAPDLAALLGR